MKEVFHGTTLQWLPNILHSGFKATVGSGCDSAAYHFGTVVSGVYMARRFNLALTYPCGPNTVGVPENHLGVSGGLMPALHPTYPVRVVLRCPASDEDRIWHKRQNAASKIYSEQFTSTSQLKYV